MAKRYQEIYHTGQLPVLQNKLFTSAEEARDCTKSDVMLVQDMQTGLIFNHSFNPELIAYDKNYQNEQATSSQFQNHLTQVESIVSKYFAGKSLIEVGCGKGYFLEYLQSCDYKITGFDPAYEGLNPDIIKRHFTSETGLNAQCILLRHVLEHIQDPVKFLNNIRASNRESGQIYIEVPCLDWICEHGAWFDIYYEHVNYFRMTDLVGMFETVYESGHLFGGQYLYVVADLASLKTPVRNIKDIFYLPEYFFDTLKKSQSIISGKSKHQSAVWGCSSKGVIFLLFMERSGFKIDCAIDINPKKQGYYLPATGTLVSSPEDALAVLQPGADIFVMNSNYLSEIQNTTKNQFNYHMVEL